jgi:hypothetical protein
MNHYSLLVNYKRHDIARGGLGVRISSTEGSVHGATLDVGMKQDCE